MENTEKKDNILPFEKIENSFYAFKNALDYGEDAILATQKFFENMKEASAEFIGYLEKKYPNEYEEITSRITGNVCRKCGRVVLKTDDEENFECMSCGTIHIGNTYPKAEHQSEFEDYEITKIIIEKIMKK